MQDGRQPDPIDIAVGSRLRKLRTARGMSLERIGRETGVTYQQVQKYETGANRVSASMLYRLARFLEVPVGELFEEVVEETQPKNQ